MATCMRDRGTHLMKILESVVDYVYPRGNAANKEYARYADKLNFFSED